MPRKQVLIAGASGLVGYAAMRVFGADPECDVIGLSRRAPMSVMVRAFCRWT